MKIAAGIAGILLGIFSLTYVGIFGSMIGSAAGLLGSIPFRGNTLGPWAEMVSMLSWLAPLATIVGGIVTFSNPRVGGIILGVSAFAHWYLLGFGVVGKLFVLPIGATAGLALFANSSTRPATNLGTTQTFAEPPSLGGSTAGPSFDRGKWNALVQYDKDIASMAEKLRPLGQKWMDEFASSYLALNDKTYLPEIERKIVASAKAEAEENERQRIHWEEQRKVALEEEKRLAQEQKEQQERLAAERKKRADAWRNFLWGTRLRQSITVGICVVIIGTLSGVVFVQYHKKQLIARAVIEYWGNRDPSFRLSGAPLTASQYALQPWVSDGPGGDALLGYEEPNGWMVLSQTVGGGVWNLTDLIAKGVPRDVALDLCGQAKATYGGDFCAERATSPSPNSSSTAKASSPVMAFVFDPPSNVRSSPNGPIVCSISTQKTIEVGPKQGDWYTTNVCGTPGVIHQAQLRF